MSISELRKSRKLTQAELGKMVGASRSAIAMWETGAALPRPDKLRKLAQILGVTVDQLLCEKEEA
ncbi:MAG: helix-turn-helix transcriptional regulator [Clostridia bacterium]|nr:helix-turn-helix transcriptional regulator [Clostridia bacterium]